MPDNQPLFRLERWPHGWLVFGAIPVSELTNIIKLCPPESVMESQVAKHYKANMAIGQRKELQEWKKEIQDKLAHCDAETRFALGTENGIASATIFLVLAKDAASRQEIHERYPSHIPSIPNSATAFKFCQKLLDSQPGWEERLWEVAAAHPKSKWKEMVKHWAKAKTLYSQNKTKELEELLDAISKHQS